MGKFTDSNSPVVAPDDAFPLQLPADPVHAAEEIQVGLQLNEDLIECSENSQYTPNPAPCQPNLAVLFAWQEDYYRRYLEPRALCFIEDLCVLLTVADVQQASFLEMLFFYIEEEEKHTPRDFFYKNVFKGSGAGISAWESAVEITTKAILGEDLQAERHANGSYCTQPAKFIAWAHSVGYPIAPELRGKAKKSAALVRKRAKEGCNQDVLALGFELDDDYLVLKVSCANGKSGVARLPLETKYAKLIHMLCISEAKTIQYGQILRELYLANVHEAVEKTAFLEKAFSAIKSLVIDANNRVNKDLGFPCVLLQSIIKGKKNTERRWKDSLVRMSAERIIDLVDYRDTGSSMYQVKCADSSRLRDHGDDEAGEDSE